MIKQHNSSTFKSRNAPRIGTFISRLKFVDTVELRGTEILFKLEERPFHSAVEDSVFACDTERNTTKRCCYIPLEPYCNPLCGKCMIHCKLELVWSPSPS